MYRSSSKKCILIRHGLTAENLEKRYIGRRSDVPLSDDGKEAAKAAGIRYGRLLPEGDYSLYSSPMLRAKETTELLFPGEEYEVRDEFSEIDFGEFDGRSYYELNGNPVYQEWVDGGAIGAFPGGETRDEFVNRTMKGFYEILGSGSDMTVIIGHMGTIRAVMSTLFKDDYFSYTVDNLSGYGIDYRVEDNEYVFLSYDSIAPGSNT